MNKHFFLTLGIILTSFIIAWSITIPFGILWMQIWFLIFLVDIIREIFLWFYSFTDVVKNIIESLIFSVPFFYSFIQLILLFKKEVRGLSKFSIVMILYSIGLSFYGYIWGWSAGLKYEGNIYLYWSFITNIIFITLILFLGRNYYKNPIFKNRALLYTVFFIWIMSYFGVWLWESI